MAMHVFAVKDQETAKSIEHADKIRQDMIGAFSDALKRGDIESVHASAVSIAMLEMEISSIEAGARPTEVYCNMKAAYEALLSRKEDVKATYAPIEVKGFEFNGFNGQN